MALTAPGQPWVIQAWVSKLLFFGSATGGGGGGGAHSDLPYPQVRG
jgi:hypothetical protein